ncbi:MAG: hypothetical protein RLQ12_24945 [Cyclobacteriaceae bacterium]
MQNKFLITFHFWLKAPLLILSILIGFQTFSITHQEDIITYESINIITGDQANQVEQKVAQLLKERIEEKSAIKVSMGEALSVEGLNILLGRLDHHLKLRNLFEQHRIPELKGLAPGPEGFLLKKLTDQTLIAAGIDDRGCLYAVGELLRQIGYEEDRISIPIDMNVRTAPAFEIRGTQFGQSRVAKNLAKVRDWTTEETQRVILDYALAGANIFSVNPGPMYDFIKSYGLMTQGGFGANTAHEVKDETWKASESIGRTGYVCLSVDAARDYMLKKCEAFAKEMPAYDLLKFHGGDGGGCECDRCDPYGLTFIKLVEEMAGIIHKHHPHTRIYFTNQKFDNADDNAIFNFLNEKPRDWLWAWGYGPGSDATTWQPGHRQTHRMDLFKYPGFGPYSLYPLEIVKQMPARHKLVYYNEITHWKYAQHAYIQMYPRADKNGYLPPHWGHDIYERRPDQYLTMVYNRLTFFAWPRNYHRVFNDLMRYGVGDITHSSGHHDHFNQWMWQRLLWAPRTTVEDVVDEYCRTWFGPEAAPYMTEGIFQLEENLEEIPGTPLPEKEGILNYYELTTKAGKVMPDLWMKDNWLWRMYSQKAALDRYVQLAVTEQIRLEQRVKELVNKCLEGSLSDQYIKNAIGLIEAGHQVIREMDDLLAEANRLGQESNDLFGVRNDGLYNLEHDFIGLGWTKRQLNRALGAKGKKRKELLTMIIDYENPGEGGFYDNLGTANHAPNVVTGYPYDHGQPYVSEMLSEENLPSQRSMHFTQDEDQGVTLHYKGLDPKAKYSLRLTLVRPWFQERYAMRMNQKSQSIYADDHLLARNVELPLQVSDFFTYKIPASVTKDGELIIRFEKSPDVAVGDRVSVEQWRNSGGWGTIVSETWLIRE